MALKMLNLNLFQVSSPSTEPNNNTILLKPMTKKCLFGAADPKDTKKLLEDQFKVERERFYERFGFTMENLENLENLEFDGVSPRKRKNNDKLKMQGEKLAKFHRTLKPYNVQMKITDYCAVKKSSLDHQKI